MGTRKARRRLCRGSVQSSMAYPSLGLGSAWKQSLTYSSFYPAIPLSSLCLSPWNIRNYFPEFHLARNLTTLSPLVPSHGRSGPRFGHTALGNNLLLPNPETNPLLTTTLKQLRTLLLQTLWQMLAWKCGMRRQRLPLNILSCSDIWDLSVQEPAAKIRVSAWPCQTVPYHTWVSRPGRYLVTFRFYFCTDYQYFY
jgi:hypothetical protein